ncbi:MAG: NAD(+) kinase [Nitrospirae bacterium]|nr:MAG: NAD(+) kinase [Nitrospirae bacterium 13_2_20CM_2_62_8]OLC00524.1 MAG: NAD(+) kinase [Nitrospirae bacterium 13_1_40CM_62_7]OLC42979.1 MAG: NAD(+) kinase [Nitrospirae bacterium 13_1_40CM_4_62_6]OLC81879.1 MAG: NAD(+) kinase [Nitrospirae bacterium 13_1_40CM_3_62_11]OLD42109.1 MAG: NAD(+) kinase [Nitrospirae bacterium 13_1_40CM_2_62_10]OLE41578.1 MAG: NAD(+) kinase [Nitrospirae bacterium 13_1_20CM_2_62_14]TLY42889.1 MAG: NAD(+) kinase [Nitrospirota bacterium]
MKTIGILTKPKFPDVKHILTDLVAWLRERKKEVVFDAKTAALIGESASHPKTQLATRSDMVLVLGGDGTMLSAARLLEERAVPILGVNMGGLGFLTEITLDQLYPALEKVFAQEFMVEERLMLRADIHRHGEHVAKATVLNDVVVSKGTLARMIEIQILIDGQFVTRLRGDGLIVSTPTGSTAYSLSAGGPIIHPTVQALILTPICPHTLTHRPLLVPRGVALEVTLTSQVEGAMATFDGQVGVALVQGDTVAIAVSEHRTQLIRLPDRTYYDLLRRKLKWGDS